jgi:hypothetical protein
MLSADSTPPGPCVRGAAYLELPHRQRNSAKIVQDCTEGLWPTLHTKNCRKSGRTSALNVWLSMAQDNLFPLIFRLVNSLPSRQEQLLIFGEAWLLVAKEDLQSAWKNEKFKEAQTYQLTMLDRMRDFISQEAELELQEQRPETGRAIEEADWGELERLEEKVKRRLAGA